MFDTCSNDSAYHGLSCSKYGEMDSLTGLEDRYAFAKGPFEVMFRYYVLSDTSGSPDGIVYRSWKDIDPSYPGIRNAFEAIENRFGTFTFQSYDYSPNDTSWFTRRGWSLTFDNYVFADSTLRYLLKVPELDTSGRDAPKDGATFDGGIVYYSNISQGSSTSSARLWPMPCSHYLYVSGVAETNPVQIYDDLGREISLPSDEITNGISVDVLTLNSGIYYLRANQQFCKIIIAR